MGCAFSVFRKRKSNKERQRAELEEEYKLTYNQKLSLSRGHSITPGVRVPSDESLGDRMDVRIMRVRSRAKSKRKKMQNYETVKNNRPEDERQQEDERQPEDERQSEDERQTDVPKNPDR